MCRANYNPNGAPPAARAFAAKYPNPNWILGPANKGKMDAMWATHNKAMADKTKASELGQPAQGAGADSYGTAAANGATMLGSTDPKRRIVGTDANKTMLGG